MVINREALEEEGVMLGNTKQVERIGRLAHFMPTPKNIFRYSTNKVTKYGANYALFAAVCIINYLMFYIYASEHITDPFDGFSFISAIGGTFCMILLVRNYWPRGLKKYFPVYWHFTLLFCLSFSTTFIFLIMQGEMKWMVNVAVAILLLSILVDSVTFAWLSFIGVSAGIFVYKAITPGSIMIDWTILYPFFYIYGFATFITLVIGRKKEDDIETEKKKIKLMGGNIGHDLDNTLGNIESYASALKVSLDFSPPQLTKDQDGKPGYFVKKGIYDIIQNLPKDLKEQSEQGYMLIKNMVEAVKQGTMTDPKKLEEIALKAFIPQMVDRYVTNKTMRENVRMELEDDFTIWATRPAMERVLHNLLKNAYRYGGGEDCKLEIRLDSSTRSLHLKDQGKGIPKSQRQKIFDSFYTTSFKGSGIGLGICKSVMEQLGGRIYCKSKQGEGSYTEFILEFMEIENYKALNTLVHMLAQE